MVSAKQDVDIISIEHSGQLGVHNIYIHVWAYWEGLNEKH